MRDRSRANSFPTLAALLAGVIALTGASQAMGREVCKPALSITNIQFSKWQLPTLERKWTATVAVDASHCAPNTAGTFEIGFLRLVENGVDIEFTEEFVWMSPAVNVGMDFWANEAVGRSWINKVSACPCAK